MHNGASVDSAMLVRLAEHILVESVSRWKVTLSHLCRHTLGYCIAVQPLPSLFKFDFGQNRGWEAGWRMIANG